MTAGPKEVPWPVPPPSGYTVEDFLVLTGLPPHTELIDGGLVFLSAQRAFDTVTIDVLVAGLRAACPVGFRVRREPNLRLTDRSAPEPDILVVRGGEDPDQVIYDAADVALVVEVVSPDSEERDRDTKPHKYAQAGIPLFWRVERTNDLPVVHTYRLDRARGTYNFTGAQRERLEVDNPFPVDIDLTEVARL